VIDLPHAFLLIAREVMKGGFTGKVFSLGLRQDVVNYVPNPVMATVVPANVMAAVDSTEQHMKDRSFSGRLLPDSLAIKSTQ
jgi:basic membrane lipoprotein Med (substrate-binding protein (PBP1-ABC) superfamily)